MKQTSGFPKGGIPVHDLLVQTFQGIFLDSLQSARAAPPQYTANSLIRRAKPVRKKPA